MSFRHLVLFLCCAHATQAAEIYLSLDRIPGHVLAQNPDLQAARLRIEEAQGRLLGSGRLANPEISFSVTQDDRFREGTLGVAFDQRFPLTSRLRLEKALSRQLVEAAELEVLEASRKAVEEAQTAAVRLLAIDQQRAMRQRQTQLAEKLAAFATDRSKAGEISPLDAAQAVVDSQRLVLEGRRLETERLALLGDFKASLGIAPADQVSLTGTLPPAVMPSGQTWQQRADYQLAKLSEEAAQTEVDLSKARKWQDMSAGVSWEGERMEDAPNGIEDTGFIGLRLSLPLPIWNRNQGEIAEKSAKVRRAAKETEALATRIENEAAAALSLMASNAQLASQSRDILLPLVVEQTDKLEKAYEAGQTDLLTVLRAREQRLQLEAAVLDATRDFHLARVRYEAATGQHAPATGK